MKRVIVAGGTGLIGRKFCETLLAGGYQVVVLSRRVIQSDHERLVYAGWDGQTTGDWTQWLEGATAVVNLAGENIGAGRWTAARKQAILSSRLKAGEALSFALTRTENKPAVLLQASAIGYYGDNGAKKMVETDPPAGDFLGQICKEWEASTLQVEALGMRRVVLRTGLVLSTEGGALPQMLMPTLFFAGGALGSGKQYWSWIHMQDQVAAMLYLMEHASCAGVYNLTSPNPLEMAAFGKTLAEVLGRPYWLPAPVFALRLLLGEMSRLLLDSQRIIPVRLLEAGYPFMFSEIKPALLNLLNKK
ncbi:MAG: TIGR01777 family oxidoreductase [Anaerolineae bacterium]|nr:TIGR01777 family oxidoreductase [Anaerolineae bacterium]